MLRFTDDIDAVAEKKNRNSNPLIKNLDKTCEMNKKESKAEKAKEITKVPRLSRWTTHHCQETKPGVVCLS